MNIDDGFRHLNRDDILHFFHFFDRDVNVQAAAQIMTQSLLSGGVWIEHPLGEMNNDNQQQLDNLRWSDWCKQLLRSLWAVGFAAATFQFDEEQRLVPTVLKLELLDVRMRRDEIGKCEFKYYTRNTPSDPEQHELPNVITFIDKPPDINLRLCSTVSGLLSDFTYEMHMLQCTVTAERARAQPMLITEQVESRYNPNDFTVTRMQDDALLGDGARSFQESMRALTGNNRMNESELETLQYDVRDMWQRYMNSEHMHNDSRLQYLSSDGRAMAAPQVLQTSLSAPAEIPLKPQQKLTRHVLPEAPANLIPFRTERQVRVFMAFSVPMSMAAHSKSKANTASAQLNNNKQDTASKDVFLNAQKELKNKLLSYIREMYRYMNYNTQLLELLMDSAKKRRKLDEGELKQKLEPRITIASLPDENLARELYELGLLKPEAYVQMMCQKYGMDERDFNKNPKPPLMSMDQQIEREKLQVEKQQMQSEEKLAKDTLKSQTHIAEEKIEVDKQKVKAQANKPKPKAAKKK